MSLLSLETLSVQIGPTAILREVSLSLAPGEIVGLVGESGSGKSMTALAIMGLLPPGAQVSGAVRLEGREITTLPERALCRLRGNEVGMIFQEPMTALNPLMTIGDQVAETLMVHQRMPRAEALAVARDRLDRVGLTAPRFPLDLYPHELSGGQRQRVAIALAIALRPRLLIADEPTTALDVTTQAEVLSLLHDLARSEGMALLLITHDLAVVAGMADRVAVMQAGRVIETGATERLFRRPKARYTADLLAASTHHPAAARTPKTGAPLLTVSAATRSYRLPRPKPFAPHPELRAVDNVSFTLGAGESLGLVGESGCGKSTLTRAILGLDPLASGAITLSGHAVSPEMPSHARADVQVVFQDPYGSFNPRQRVERLVAEPFHLTGRPADWRERVAEALREVGLSPDDRGKFIHEFSGGQRQRIAIARALITRPKLIVLDEAVSALDVRVRAQVLDLLAGLQRSHDLAYLFISHDLSVVRAVTTRCLVMQAGRIVEQGLTEALFTAPQHAYTARLLAAAPQIPQAWTEERHATALV
ncbi:dipeptide ABC transporter ATP-binding protein [Sinirhodobacter sp. WL0062]|uniref:Dipeptide ABC transporter ATP-binding protein n=1 Tax=Rhodobacter flavimaris TaxID=2907145 RepID=A0ABS8YYJ1_9RHOB|nr:dipeptide ABC transporter ATP-binding protein [Sinirhodobacter sp. WL0062]MCE5973496.1 dipeptide ABC transporter ATP-binding protein [Sinirhodobacter sp. WL0062]